MEPSPSTRRTAQDAAALSSKANLAAAQGDLQRETELRQASFSAWRTLGASSENTQRESLLRAVDEAERLGVLYASQEQFVEAAQALKDALELLRSLAERPDERHVMLIERSALLEFMNESYREALTLYREAYAMRCEFGLGEARHRASALIPMVILLLDLEGPAESNSAMGKLCMELARVTEPPDKSILAEELRALSLTVTASRRLDIIEKIAEQELQLLQALGPELRGACGEVKCRLGNLHFLQGRTSEAITWLNDGLQDLVSTSSGYDPEIILARQRLAHLCMLGKNPMRSESLIQQNLRDLELAGGQLPPVRLAEGYLDAASYRFANCKYQEAHALLTKAGEQGAFSHPELRARAFELRYRLSRGEEERAAALREFEREFDRTEQDVSTSERQVKGMLILEQMSNCIRHGRIDKAAECLEQAERLWSSGDLPEHETRLHEAVLARSRAELCDAQGDPTQARALLQKSLILLDDLPQYRGTFLALPAMLDLAELCLRAGEYDAVVEQLLQAREVLERGGRTTHVFMLSVLQGLGAAYESLGRQAEAEECRGTLEAVMTDLQILNDGMFEDSGDRPQ